MTASFHILYNFLFTLTLPFDAMKLEPRMLTASLNKPWIKKRLKNNYVRYEKRTQNDQMKNIILVICDTSSTAQASFELREPFIFGYNWYHSINIS
jgi:hypothetical protein